MCLEIPFKAKEKNYLIKLIPASKEKDLQIKKVKAFSDDLKYYFSLLIIYILLIEKRVFLINNISLSEIFLYAIL